jgi:hypothetical protein
VRTKLVRDQYSAAMCLSEAVAHHVLDCLGLEVAKAWAVITNRDFSEDLSRQLHFEPAVIPGRHWGTQVIGQALETTLSEQHYEDLGRPADVFMIYLTDVILAYHDRQTPGNILLVPSWGGKRMNIVPIDQSECFFGTDALCAPGRLMAKRDQSEAVAFAGMEQLIIREGASLVDRCTARVKAARKEILDSVAAPPDEWYERAGIMPEELCEFLEYRLDNLDSLARVEHWQGLPAAAGDENVYLF